MAWKTNDDLVRRRVEIETAFGDFEEATVLAVSDRTANVKVRADDGEVLIGGRFEEI